MLTACSTAFGERPPRRPVPRRGSHYFTTARCTGPVSPPPQSRQPLLLAAAESVLEVEQFVFQLFPPLDQTGAFIRRHPTGRSVRNGRYRRRRHRAPRLLVHLYRSEGRRGSSRGGWPRQPSSSGLGPKASVKPFVPASAIEIIHAVPPRVLLCEAVSTTGCSSAAAAVIVTDPPCGWPRRDVIEVPRKETSRTDSGQSEGRERRCPGRRRAPGRSSRGGSSARREPALRPGPRTTQGDRHRNGRRSIEVGVRSHRADSSIPRDAGAQAEGRRRGNGCHVDGAPVRRHGTPSGETPTPFREFPSFP